MRFLIQRVLEADVSVEGKTVGKIDKGILVLIGIRDDDTREIADKMCEKLVKLRIFKDENGKTNLSVGDVGGSILMISQFTLYADMHHGNRPSFIRAGRPEMSEPLYEYILSKTESFGYKPEHGIFGAEMKVSLVNDGPFTAMLDSDEIL